MPVATDPPEAVVKGGITIANPIGSGEVSNGHANIKVCRADIDRDAPYLTPLFHRKLVFC
jgi:hypothetical protein